MQSKATTVAQYLEELPQDRRDALQAIREVILKNVDPDVEEGMQYGMIGYYVPHRVYPPGYHCDPRQPLPYAGLASQKNHMALYLMSIYAEPGEDRWLRDQWAKSGRKLDMGKCCIRFRKLEDVPLDVIAEVFRRVPLKRHLELYEAVVRDARKSRPATAVKKATKAGSAAKKKPAAGKRGVPKKTPKKTPKKAPKKASKEI